MSHRREVDEAPARAGGQRSRQGGGRMRRRERSSRRPSTRAAGEATLSAAAGRWILTSKLDRDAAGEAAGGLGAGRGRGSPQRCCWLADLHQRACPRQRRKGALAVEACRCSAWEEGRTRGGCRHWDIGSEASRRPPADAGGGRSSAGGPARSCAADEEERNLGSVKRREYLSILVPQNFVKHVKIRLLGG
jgi:hypothetical protein